LTTEFEVRHADFSSQSLFAEPAFDLFRDPSTLHGELYRRLATHGLRLNELKWDSPNVGDTRLFFYLLSYGVTVQLFVDRLELQAPDALRLESTALQAAISALFAAIAAAKGPAVRSHAVTINSHGVLSPTGTKEFIDQFAIRTPEGLSPPIGTAVVFYFGPANEFQMSSVTFDRSATVPEGLFFRVYCLWEASRVPTDATVALVTTQFWKAAEDFKLSRKPGMEGK
jgi:hypothetical protein